MKKLLLMFVGFFTLNWLYARSSTPVIGISSNINAFLRTIQFAEGTFYQNNPYAVTYGYDHIIKDFSDHPALTGEWAGKKLPEKYCIGAGLLPGCKSTAAGAYQIIRPTWIAIKKKLPKLLFDQDGQDQGAIQLIKEKDALEDVQNGWFEDAIIKVSTVWASLPGSPYGQPTRSMEELYDFYLSQGGSILS